MKRTRKHWTSKLFEQVKVGEYCVLIPVVDDLENDQLIWHFERAADEEDYEYMSACHTEAKSRNIVNLLKKF
jgi:hypothetical protein